MSPEALEFHDDFDDETVVEPREDEPPQQAPKRKGGRPLGSKTRKAARRAAERDESDEEDETLTSDGLALPLFQTAVGRNVAYIRVTRVEPNEGTLGNLEDPTSTTQELASRFGGGTFRLSAISTDHKIMKSTTVKIAGDPIFQSRTAEALWKRSLGIRDITPPPAASPEGLSFKELLLLMSEKESSRQANDSQLQERMARVQLEADERRRKDQEESDRRRRADDEERERRASQQRREDLERSQQTTAQMMAMMQQGHAQSLQFMQQQLAALQASAASAPAPQNSMFEAMKTIAMVKDTFGGDGGGGDAEETNMQLLIKHAPAWLNAAGTAITGAVREIKGNPEVTPNPAGGTSYRAQATNLLQALPTPIAEKAETLVTKLLQKGRDPERELDRILGSLIVETEKLPTPGQQLRPVAARVAMPQHVPHQPEHGEQYGPVQQKPTLTVVEATATVTPIREHVNTTKTQVTIEPEKNGTVSMSFQRVKTP